MVGLSFFQNNVIMFLTSICFSSSNFDVGGCYWVVQEELLRHAAIYRIRLYIILLDSLILF
jgi:hypothetical protein